MLKLAFSWLDHHAWVYWAIAAVPTAALLGLTVAGFRSSGGATAARRRDGWFLVLAIVFLFAWRWPFLLEAKELNPDEGQFIAGAQTLVHDPVFWRSVDGVTSGPLNYAVLLPIPLVGLPLDYFTTRLVGLALVAIALVACYRLLRRWAPPLAAQLAVFPALVFFATVTDGDFVHYSSEHVPMALFATGAYWLFRRAREQPTGPALELLAGAFCIGCLPWAKLQAGPLGAVVILLRLAWIGSARTAPLRPRLVGATAVIGGVLAPSLLAFAALIATGQVGQFYARYIRMSVAWVGAGDPLLTTFRQLVRFLTVTNHYPVFLGAVVLALAAGAIALVGLRRRPHAFGWGAAIVVLVAFASVFTPRHPWSHYFLFSVWPLTLWLGCVLADVWEAPARPRWLGIALLAAVGFWPLAHRLGQPAPNVFGRFVECWRHPYSVTGAIVRAYAKPGDTLAVWGWKTDLYVDSGLPQAIRDPHTAWSIWETPARPYYRADFLRDLQRSQPTFFVDAVGPGAIFFPDRGAAHESFPELADHIREHYDLLIDLTSERLYVRRDSPVAAPGQLSLTQLQRISRNARAHPLVALPPDSLEPANLGRWDLEGRSVQMMLPPARMTWVLKGGEREVSVEFGFHPRAYTEGRSNGADLVVELESPGHPASQLFRRHLDPAREPADRGLLLADIPLPPLAGGTRVIVRTEPGEYGDQAWDWVYVAALRIAQVPVATAIP